MYSWSKLYKLTEQKISRIEQIIWTHQTKNNIPRTDYMNWKNKYKYIWNKHMTNKLLLKIGY